MYLKNSLVAATLLFSFSAYAQTTKLVLVKGNKYEVSTTTTVTSVSSIMGQEVESSGTTITVEKFEVMDTRVSETDLISIITRMVVNATAMGQETNYDSDNKDLSAPGAEEMGKAVNKPKNITINADGKVTSQDIDGSNTATALMGAGAATNGIALFREALIGKNFVIGASWADSVVTKTDKMSTSTVGAYTVISIDSNIAVISYLGTTTIKGTLEQMGQEMEMNSTSKLTGETKLDLATGLPIESTSSSDGTMTMDIGGMSIPATMKTVTSTKTKQL